MLFIEISIYIWKVPTNRDDIVYLFIHIHCLSTYTLFAVSLRITDLGK